MRALLLLLLTTTTAAFASEHPKNVILLIADGAGTAHFTVTSFWRGADFQIGRMTLAGMATTYCADRAVTDSAAAASALATGEKAVYEAVSVGPDGKPRKTVLEEAEAHGKATGLVTTAYFYDATPSAFASHVTHRGQYEEIIRQMLHSGAEVIVGARTPTTPALDDMLKDGGFTLVNSREDLDASKAPHVLALFTEQPRDADFPEASLAVLARSAIERLRSDPDGFFLMVEHEGTDSGSHQNDTDTVRSSAKSFDAAVGVALDFAAADGNTLVVVTGDHETGGMRLSETASHKLRLEWSTTDHTASAVPVFAFGRGVDAFSGRFMDNTDIGKTLMGLVGE